MKCEFCGTINPNGSEKCSFCGNSLSTTEHTLNNNIENDTNENAVVQNNMLSSATENVTNASTVQTPVQNTLTDNSLSENIAVQNAIEKNLNLNDDSTDVSQPGEMLTNNMVNSVIESAPVQAPVKSELVGNNLSENVATQSIAQNSLNLNNGILQSNNTLTNDVASVSKPIVQNNMVNNVTGNVSNVSSVQVPAQDGLVNDNLGENVSVQTDTENSQTLGNGPEVLTSDTPINSGPMTQNNQNIVTQNSMVNNSISVPQSGGIESNNFTSTRASKSKAPKIIALIVVLLALLGVGFWFLVKTPKSIFTNTTKRLYSSLKKSLESNYNTMYSKITIKPYISSNQNLNGTDKIINNISLDLEGSIDYESKKFFYNINTKYYGKELLNMDIQYDKDAYVILNNLFENPIKFDNVDMTDAFKKADNKNLSIMLEGYVDALNNSLKSEYLKSKNEEIEINNKKVKAKANTLTLTKTIAEKIVKDISENLQNNKEFIKAFKEFSGKNESDTQKYLKNMKVNDKFKPTNIIIYTTGITESVVKFSVKSDSINFDVEVGDSDNNLILSLESNGMTIKLDYRFNVKYNEKVKLKNVTNAVNYKEITAKSSEIINKFVESEGFNALNSDLKNSMGMDLKSKIIAALENILIDSTDLPLYPDD